MELRQTAWKLIDWVYPPHCVVCDKPGSFICSDCLSDAVQLDTSVCRICGKPIIDGLYCKNCKGDQFSFDRCRAAYIYGGVIAEGIKKLKYAKNLEIAEKFGDFLFSIFLRENWKIDMIIPVPLSKERRKERGFNQSEWIAGAFSRKSGIPVKPTALQKVRNTRTQVGLNREEREMNLRGAFMAEPLLIQEKKVLLVDDVMTTGSTFNECAFALKQHGASKVYCLSVATTDLD